MLDSINPERLQQFTRCLIHAAQRRLKKEETVQQVQQHVEKIKQYAVQKKVKKHALRKELNILHAKVAAILDVERDISIKEQDLVQTEGRTAETAEELKKRIALLEQKLTLFNEKYSDDVLIFVDRLEKVNNVLGQVCKRMDVQPPQSELDELGMKLSQLEITAQLLQEQGHNKAKIAAIRKKIRILKGKLRKAKA